MKPLYETKKFALVNFLEIDLEESNYYDWWNDLEVCKYNSHGLFPRSNSEQHEWIKQIENNEIIVWAIILKTDSTHIGNISLQSFNWINRSAEFAIVIGEKDYWGQRIAECSLKILIDHGFDKLNLHRIWSGTAETNCGMRRVFEKLGMKYEGNFRDGTFLDGKYRDIHCWGILENERPKKN
jgi:RimJ/RimL family protein N-acetyltransferase